MSVHFSIVHIFFSQVVKNVILDGANITALNRYVVYMIVYVCLFYLYGNHWNELYFSYKSLWHCKKCSFKGEITWKLNLENSHMIAEYGKQFRFIHKHIHN